MTRTFTAGDGLRARRIICILALISGTGAMLAVLLGGTGSGQPSDRVEMAVSGVFWGPVLAVALLAGGILLLYLADVMIGLAFGLYGILRALFDWENRAEHIRRAQRAERVWVRNAKRVMHSGWQWLLGG
ncbi:hypothetical protein [Paracoccus pacificus]|uniref:Uncharacterized protein n=1 Tax=Paracoccus pacificus TaxID=1463598 RepID=A0ABW4R9L0_9RHOB